MNIHFIFIACTILTANGVLKSSISDPLIRNKIFSKPTNAFGGYNKDEVSEIKKWIADLEESQIKTKKISFPDSWADIQGRWLLRYISLSYRSI
jgi:hypothetical protein